jgi:hemolysin activation/secretion protein
VVRDRPAARLRRAALCLLASAACAAGPGTAAAQAVFTPPDPRRAPADPRAGDRPGALGPAPELSFTSQTPPANAAEIRLTLRRVTLEGGTVYSDAELAPIFADALGGEITLAEVFAIAARLQSRYRKDGYLFTRVVVPAQRIEAGEVRLEIVEAVITRVEVEEPEAPLGPVRELAARLVAPLRDVRNPTSAQIERVLLLLNDIPGVTRAAAVPKLGAETRGAIELYINMERDALALTAFADNRQSPLIGRGLIGAVGSFNSWSPYGDSTELSVFGSAGFDDPFPDDFEERWTVQLDHTHFIRGTQGTRLEFTALHSESRPGDIVSDFDISADQTEIGRALKLDVFAGVEHVQVNSLTPAVRIGGVAATPDLVVDDTLTIVFAGLEGTQRDAWGFSEGRLELRNGIEAFGTTERADPDKSRDDGDGGFISLRGEIERTVEFSARHAVWAKAWGQWTTEPLLASEEMAVGGTELGRAFFPSEASGDLGAGAAVELRYARTFRWDTFSAPYELYGFADWAEVRNLRGGQPEHQAIASAGVGLRAQLPGRLAVNVEAVKPVDDRLSYDQSDKWRLLVSATKEF